MAYVLINNRKGNKIKARHYTAMYKSWNPIKYEARMFNHSHNHSACECDYGFIFLFLMDQQLHEISNN